MVVLTVQGNWGGVYLRVNLQKCRENKLKAGRKESKFYGLLIGQPAASMY